MTHEQRQEPLAPLSLRGVRARTALDLQSEWIQRKHTESQSCRRGRAEYAQQRNRARKSLLLEPVLLLSIAADRALIVADDDGVASLAPLAPRYLSRRLVYHSGVERAWRLRRYRGTVPWRLHRVTPNYPFAFSSVGCKAAPSSVPIGKKPELLSYRSWGRDGPVSASSSTPPGTSQTKKADISCNRTSPHKSQRLVGNGDGMAREGKYSKFV